MADKDYVFTAPDGRKIRVTVAEGQPMPTDADLDKMFASLPKKQEKPTPLAPKVEQPPVVTPPKPVAPPVSKPVAAPTSPAVQAFKLPGMDMAATPQLPGSMPSASSLIVPQKRQPMISDMSTRTTSALPAVAPPKAIVPPDLKMRQDIENYTAKYLSPDASKGLPHQLLRAYLNAPPEKREAVIANISDLGKMAIREVAKDPVMAYVHRFLTSATPQSAPYKAFIQYATLPEDEAEAALKGFTETGKTAIRQLVQNLRAAQDEEIRRNKAVIESTYEREMSKGIPPRTAGLMSLGMTAGENWNVFANMADRGATMMRMSRLRGGDIVSPAYADVLALGYDPQGALLPSSGTGAGGAGRRLAAEMIFRPSSMALNVAGEGVFGLAGAAIGAGAKALAGTAKFQRFAQTARGQAAIRNAGITGQLALRGGIPATVLAPGIAEKDWQRVFGEIPVAFLYEVFPLMGLAARGIRRRANNMSENVSILDTSVPITKFQAVDANGNIVPDARPEGPALPDLIAERDSVLEELGKSWRERGSEDPTTQELNVRLMDLDDRVRSHPDNTPKPEGPTDAVQVEGAGAGVLRTEEPGLGLQEVGQGDQATPVEVAGEGKTSTGVGPNRVEYQQTDPQPTQEVTVTNPDGTNSTVQVEVATQGAEPVDTGFVPDVETTVAGAERRQTPTTPQPGEFANSLLRRVLNYRNEIYGAGELASGTETARIKESVDQVLADPDMQRNLIAEALDPTTDPDTINYKHQVAAAIHESNLRREYQDLTTKMINAKTAAENARAAGNMEEADAADAVYNSLLGRTVEIQREGAALIRIAAKVNSAAGTILWMQGAFKNSLDFSNPDAVEVALHQTQAMLNKGNVPDSVREKVLAEVNAHSKIGEAEYQRVYNEIRRKGQQAQERRTGARTRAEGEAAPTKKQRRYSDEQHQKNIERVKELLRGRVGIVYDPKQEAERALELTRGVADLIGYYLETGVMKFADIASNVRGAVGNVSDLVMTEAWIKAKADARTAWLASEEGKAQQSRETTFAQELVKSIGNAKQADEFIEAIRDADGQSRILEKLFNGDKLTPEEAQRATAAWDSARVRRQRADGETVETQVKQFAEVRNQVRRELAAAAREAKKEQARSLEGVRARISNMLDRVLETRQPSARQQMSPEAKAEYQAAVKFKQGIRKAVKDYTGLASEENINRIVNEAVDSYKNDPTRAQGILDDMVDRLNASGGDQTLGVGLRRQMRANPSYGQYTDEILNKLSDSTYQALVRGANLTDAQITEIARVYNDVIPQRQQAQRGPAINPLDKVREAAANLRSSARREANAVKAAAAAAERARTRASFDDVKRRSDEMLDAIGKPTAPRAGTVIEPGPDAKAYRAGAQKLRAHINKVLDRYKGTMSPDEAEAAVNRAVEAYKQEPGNVEGIMSDFTVEVQRSGGMDAAKSDMARRLGRVFGSRVNEFFDYIGPDIQNKLLSGEKLTPDESKVVGDAYVALRQTQQNAIPAPRDAGIEQVMEAGREAMKQGRRAKAAAERSAREATTLGFLQKRYGNKRGQEIFNLMPPEMRDRFESVTDWTAVDTDQLADFIIATKPERAVSPDINDPRYKIVRDAADSARRKSQDYQTPEEYRKRADEILDRLGTDYEKPKGERRTNPLLDEATLAYMQGARRLESFKAWVKSNFGDKLSNDEINALFSAAAKDYQNQTASLVDIKGRIGEEVGRALWESSSRGERLKMMMMSAASLYKVISLTTDIGVLGTQFGLLGLSRPGVPFYGKAPRTPSSGAVESWVRRILGATSGKEGNTAIQAFRKSFKSQQGLDEVMADLELLAETRHGNKDVYYESYRDNPDNLMEAPVPGFDLISRTSGKTLFGETLTQGIGQPDTLELMRLIPGVRKISPMFEKFMRGTDGLINTYKVVLFESMFEPFTHLKGVQRVQAGRAISTAVNTFAGMGRYDKDGQVERSIRGLSIFMTAPRFYTSNFEVTAPEAVLANYATSLMGPQYGVVGQMAGAALAPIRPLTAARIKGQPNLPTAEQAKIAAVISGEYVRVGVMLQALNATLRSTGIGYVATNAEDPNYGSAVINHSPTSQVVIPLLGQAGAWHRDLTQLVSGRVKDPETGEYRRTKHGDKLATMFINKMLPPPQFVPSLMFPSKASTEETADFMQREYTLPGGKDITPSEPMQSAWETGKYVMPAPILLKLVTNDIERLWNNRGASNFAPTAAALATADIANFFGYGARVQVKPSVMSELRKDKEFKELMPSQQRRAEEMTLFGGR